MEKQDRIISRPTVSMTLVACLPLLSMPVEAQVASEGILQELYAFHGNTYRAELGLSVAGAGDVNRDGVNDVIVGSPGARSRQGSIYVYSGKNGRLLWWHDSMEPFSGFGYSVSGAGDVNKDGLDDVIVGAVTGANYKGYALVLSGRFGETLWKFEGASQSSLMGYTVAGAGDVNQDGFDDVIVGAPQAAIGAADPVGSVFVFSGRDGSVIWQFDAPLEDETGYSVAGAGDVNGDGHADLIVGATGANHHSGSAFVYSGKDGTEIWRLDGVTGDLMGWSVSAAGDVNLDGFDDVIVGAPGARSNFLGSARVYSGKDGATLWRFTGGKDLKRVGWSVAGAGDVNMDGIPDLIVGATDHGDVRGTAILYSGFDGGVLAQIVGEEAWDHLGFSVAGAGDLERDGSHDILVGIPQNGVTTNGPGIAIVYKYKPALRAYGSGLAGSGNIAPVIGSGGEQAKIGSASFVIQITEAVGSSPCLIAGSFSRAETQLGAGTLYGDYLTPGEFFLTPAFLTSGTPGAPGAGTATLPIQIPNDPTLLGFQSFWQGFVMDLGAPFGVSHTGGLEVTVVR